VDGAGQPWILEINANPCLSPDAGFAAALDRASIPFDEAIQRILEEVFPYPSAFCSTMDCNGSPDGDTMRGSQVTKWIQSR
jgi:hypothetical protein